MCAATHRGPVAKKWLRHREINNKVVVPGLVDLRRQSGGGGGKQQLRSHNSPRLVCLTVLLK